MGVRDVAHQRLGLERDQHDALANQLASFGAVAAEFWLASALYHAAVGDRPSSEALFRKALDLNVRYSLPWDEAEVAYKWGLSLSEQGAERDDLLKIAENRWQAIGAHDYAARCTKELAR